MSTALAAIVSASHRDDDEDDHHYQGSAVLDQSIAGSSIPGSRAGNEEQESGNEASLVLDQQCQATSLNGADSPQPIINGKGKGKAQLDSTAKGGKKEYKVRQPQKKMERFDCRGTMVINILDDGTSTFLSILHNLNHVDYVDVVGNRLRGVAKVSTPRLIDGLAPPLGSSEIPGETPHDAVENTFDAMSDLVTTLRAQSNGLEVVEELYKMTRELREYRVSVMEALRTGETGGNAENPNKRRRLAN